MNQSDQELEVKFYLSQREKLEAKIVSLGGQLVAPRVHEVNLRFDTPDQALLNSGRLLRLRQDTRVRLTYKGTGSIQGEARLRQELELTVSDFDTAQALLEGLGFQVSLMYEKYRTTYRLGTLELALDEMPYGDFLEIEGPDGNSIRVMALQLGLDWERRNLDSYTVIFENARRLLGFTFRDLSFTNFVGIQVTPAALGMRVADTDV